MQDLIEIRIRENDDGTPMRSSRLVGPTGVLLPGETLKVPREFFAFCKARGVPVEEATTPAATAAVPRKKKAAKAAAVPPETGAIADFLQ